MTNMNLRLPDEVHAEMERLSNEHDRSINGEIIQACKAWIEGHRTHPVTFYVKLGADGLPTGVFLPGRQFWDESSPVHEGEQWATIEAMNIDELQERMKTMTKKWMTTSYGGGEKVKKEVEAETREEAIDQAADVPWHVTKVTARKPKLDEKDDQVELKFDAGKSGKKK